MASLELTERVAVQTPIRPRIAVKAPEVQNVTAVAVLRGPAGPPGGVVISYRQTEPVSTWTVETGLGRPPASLIIVVGGEVVDTDTEVNANQVILTFPSPTAGEVYIS